ncbi:hemerythrin domain-containing protein [Celeribacter neptunius]|uniref:Hemerythrin HHE cation binding domain-containing protein n=1 Tax=Celeribacter neptunius TaxID=588602 RepID=A0A1I3R5W9_9RHOB|nr:hemerythrin domain-containing protein [Celeribacter neptunius]SFJ41049.1 Hemerythrin HHE cation binding domain-containing protein [Celeribacter neptunius]
MKSVISNTRRGNPGDDATKLELLEEPLEFIKEDHMHMRAVCDQIDHIADTPLPKKIEISNVLRALSNEVPLLVKDEEEDLAALILARCTPDDEIEVTLERLHREHLILSEQLPAIRRTLEVLHDAHRRATEQERTELRAFSHQLRQHIIVENALLLPFAKARLTEDDLTTLRNKMITRRIQTMVR